MKKLLIAMCLVLLLSSSVQGSDPNEAAEDFISFRLMTEPEFKDGVAYLESWLGLGKGDSEVGLVVGYETWQEEDGSESRISLGAFTMHSFPDARQTLENLLWPIELLPEAITAIPALGVEGLFDLDNKGIRISPILELTVYESLAIQTKYNIFTDDVDVKDSWQIGLSAKWMF